MEGLAGSRCDLAVPMSWPALSASFTELNAASSFSLKFREISFGATSSVAPAAGTAFCNFACAHATSLARTVPASTDVRRKRWEKFMASLGCQFRSYPYACDRRIQTSTRIAGRQGGDACERRWRYVYRSRYPR